MFKKLLSILLIILHLVTFGPIREALAFSAESANYKLTAAALNQGDGQTRRLPGPTKLLLHADGADGSTGFSDDTGHTVLSYGNARIDTNQSKFGLSSAFFDGQNSYLSLADNPDWSFGSSDFTIDLWVKFKDLAGHPAQNFLTQENGRTPGKWGFWDFSYNNGKLYLTFVD
ncbi:MAG: hypothetical protein Q8N85_02175, partial [Candidatus Omnitrophota bacterium]|nr:hypothetical protein [Candidatus Omnitrophota bacterium]